MKDPETYNYFPCVVTLLLISFNTYYTITEGLKANSDAIQASFTKLTAGEASITYQILYPKHILAPTKSTSALDKLGGYTWAKGWETRDVLGVCTTMVPRHR